MTELETTRHGQENEPRNVAVYLARMHSGLTLEEIGKNLNHLLLPGRISTEVAKKLAT